MESADESLQFRTGKSVQLEKGSVGNGITQDPGAARVKGVVGNEWKGGGGALAEYHPSVGYKRAVSRSRRASSLSWDDRRIRMIYLPTVFLPPPSYYITLTPPSRHRPVKDPSRPFLPSSPISKNRNTLLHFELHYTPINGENRRTLADKDRSLCNA